MAQQQQQWQRDIGWRRGDVLLAAGVALAALGVWVLLLCLPGRGVAAEVAVDGRVVATLPLAQDTVLTVPGTQGGNVVTVSGGRVSISAADCPDRLCVRHCAVWRTGESIVCLPHRVRVTVVGGRSAVDGEV